MEKVYSLWFQNAALTRIKPPIIIFKFDFHIQSIFFYTFEPFKDFYENNPSPSLLFSVH